MRNLHFREFSRNIINIHQSLKMCHGQTVHITNLCHTPLWLWSSNVNFIFWTFSNFWCSIIHKSRFTIGDLLGFWQNIVKFHQNTKMRHVWTVHASNLCYTPLRPWGFNSKFINLTFTNFSCSILRKLHFKFCANCIFTDFREISSIFITLQKCAMAEPLMSPTCVIYHYDCNLFVIIQVYV